ncbi:MULTISPECIES: LysR family transcriptional regulator [Acinetobacter]|jgi:DNA-binding transcriptional LysR family regulator|uniref:LysR family transcriptional regulator n=1 Tax=Acinetobacter entericus TaxID=2989714 RepID=A0ABT3NJ89_9GAMM|nr:MULTISPECIES: LysR family transcriptional regulator [Acinetobacter]MCW8039616.1 LysR family transcriptional regulator [Acinetobacter entericus]TCB76883.1 LysR family transcriptional regulator [Acinetobacter sp. ANC 4177]
MELRHLRYYVAVVEEQSFTKAAEKLFIAQPPLSRQIQNLEAELGTQLFERGSRPLKTTEAGYFFYQHAVKLLSNAEEIKAMTQRIGLVEKTVTMGFVGSLLYGLLPKIVYLFRQQHPYLKIELIEMSTKDQIIALKEGRIDVGFGRLRISDPAVRRVLLREEPLMVAVHASHPLAQQKKQQEGVYLADIVDENHFLYPSHPKPNFSTQVRHLFSEHGLDPKNLKEVREIQLALGLVAAGEGICIVPESAKTIQFPHLHYIPVLDDSAKSPIFLAIRCMDESDHIRSLFDCIYQVYDLEAIQYDRAVI